MSQDDDELLKGYISRTFPVQWVGWSMEATDPSSKRAFDAILFDETGNSLRDLTDESVRCQVADLVIRDPVLRKAVQQEVDAWIEGVLDDMVKKGLVDDREE